MMCQKHCTCSMTQMVWKIAGIMVTVVGAVTIAGMVMSKCGCLKGKAKYIARECECAAKDAARRVSDAMENCMPDDEEEETTHAQ